MDIFTLIVVVLVLFTMLLCVLWSPAPLQPSPAPPMPPSQSHEEPKARPEDMV